MRPMSQAYPLTMDTRELMARAQTALGVSQEKMGKLIGVSRRTIIRYQQRGGILFPGKWETLARACYPRDRALAIVLAARAGATLVDLGLEQPPPPPAPPAPPSPAPEASAPKRPAPLPEHMLDSILCAAASAMQASPQAASPPVFAAFERAVALGMSCEEVLAIMRPPKVASKRR